MALNALNVLEHNQGKFGIVTVIDAEMYSLTTGEPILALDTLKIANISSESSMKEVRGGQSATQLIIYDFARTINLEVQDALASMASLQYLLGDTLVESGVQKHVTVAGLTANGTSVTLTGYEVVNGSKLTIVGASSSATITVDTSDNVTISGGNSVIDTNLNETVTVYAIVNAAAGAQQITLKADSFSENVKLVGKTFLIDQATGVRKAAELIIHNFHLSPTFTLAFDSEGDAGVFDFSGMALEDPNGDMLTIKYLNENA